MIIHWLVLKNECWITYLEKKIENPNYKLGDTEFKHPAMNIYGSFILILIQYVCFSLVYFRYLKTIKSKYHSLMYTIWIIFIIHFLLFNIYRLS